MDGKSYQLTIRSSYIYKEVDISAETLFLHIGTMQDCDVRLKRELFDIPVSVSVWFTDGSWHASCEAPLFFLTDPGKKCQMIDLRLGSGFSVHSTTAGQQLFTLTLSYDFDSGTMVYDTIVDIRGVSRLTVGSSPDAQICLRGAYMGDENILLSRNADGSFQLDPAAAPESATLNGCRVFEPATVREFDFIGIADYSFYYKNGVLYTAIRDDIAFQGISAQPLRDETPAFSYPKLNRSPRMLYAADTSPIEVLNPPAKPEKPKDNLIVQLSPTLLMIALNILIRSGLIAGLETASLTSIVTTVTTMFTGIFTTLASFVYNRWHYKKLLDAWNRDYAAYINTKRREIESERQDERAALLDLYPSSAHLRDFVKTFSGRIFERSPEDTDFLYVRAGLGPVAARRKLVYPQEERIKLENELMVVPEQLCQQYAELADAPVLLHLRQSGAIGVYGPETEQYDFFKTLLLDICVQHSYEDVQIVVLIPPGEQKKYEWIKWIPHIKSSGKGGRGIVCDDESRDDIFEELYALMAQRDPSSDPDAAVTPHYVVFVLEEYGIKTHPLSQYMDDLGSAGLSFIYFKQYRENLPRECVELVELYEGGGVLRRSDDKSYACPFTREHINDESIRFVADRLAPVYCEKIALSSRLTADISLFGLLNIISPEDLDLAKRWSRSDVQRSLSVPLGVDVKGSKVSLDLHEKAHGPHGLIAGTTGSGKSEIIQTFILSAATRFHPYEVSFVIIDFKGGGMANQFADLPHLVGKITDLDSREISRSLLSIRAELEKRKRLFAQCGVNHIDQYIGKYRSGNAEIALPHLVLIVDEFAELKAEQPEFMKELISAARVGRSLGIHLILATQKPAGQVDEQIWSNSRFRLCLKVATREDSREVLHSPLASEICEPGRAYLQVGNNEIFTLFQSAYSGAPAESDKKGNIREFRISEVSFTGKRSLIYERKAARSSDGSKLTQLKALVGYISDHCRQAGIERLPSICPPPLPEILDYQVRTPRSSSRHLLQIGVYDDPASQQQPDVMLDLSAANVLVVGAAQTGKTMLLRTVLRRVAEQFTPEQLSVYILDFGSKVLKIFEAMNHVGGVLTDTDDERLKNYFKMIREEIDLRKEAFSRLGVGSYELYVNTVKEAAFPRILVLVDNLPAFREMCPEFEDDLLNLCREGLAVGITLIATAKQTAGLSYRYLSNFAARIAFNCTESSEYSNIFDRCKIYPQNYPGRGLIAIRKTVYEFQAVLPFDGIVAAAPDEIRREGDKRIQQIRAFITQTAEKYGEVRARAIPEIPPVLTQSYWAAHGHSFGAGAVPLGLLYEDIAPVTLELCRVGSIGILGEKGLGKGNLVRTVMRHLQDHLAELPCEVYLIGSFDRRLDEFASCSFVRLISADCADFNKTVQIFADKAQERMALLRAGSSLDAEPLLLCIVQNQQVFATNTVSKAACEQLRGLLSSGRQFRLCFIFANLENSSEFAPSGMLKLSRELERYILLDDLANIRLFGAGRFTPAELRKFKKPLSLGDGYLYSQRDGLEKLKLVKTERKEQNG